MTPQRLWHTCMLAVQRNGYKRANYLRKHNLFHHVGNKVYIQGRILPLYSELISLGDNVKIASRVNFITHSIIHSMLNSAEGLSVGDKLQEQIGCIEIGNNVFIGAGSTILSNVKVGSNVIIAAGSMITKDIPSNSVVGGVPARVIEPLDEYLSKLETAEKYPAHLAPKKQTVSDELADYLWKQFTKERNTK